MIKEKIKKTKYNFKKTKAQICIEYLRTVLCSVLLAVVVTTFLSINARNEMIENLSTQKQEQSLLDKKIALEIIAQTDLLKDLKNKSYSVCLHAGELCEMAGDYVEAEYAYNLAIQKSKSTKYYEYYKLICVLTAQGKISEALDILDGIKDVTDKSLIKFKTRAYITIGDKYYSIGKPLSAAKSYEQAEFYYNKFSKKDKVIVESIENRIVNSYIQTADIMVQSGLNTEALRYLKKAEKILPESINIKYKLAIILSDLDPEKSIAYIEELLKIQPQYLDYSLYNKALMKSANIADLDGRPTKAKYYRYKIHSIDLFINRKVVYKNDIDVALKSFSVKKVLFKYPLKATYTFLNNSNIDIQKLKGDFVLCQNDKPLETITLTIAEKNNPMLSYTIEPNEVEVDFKRKIYTQKELASYTIKIYLYKDEKYKTLVSENRIPKKSF